VSDAIPASPPLSPPPRVATAAAASKAAAERKKAWREEEEKQASLGKTKVDDITNQLKALKAEDRSAHPSTIRTPSAILQLSPTGNFTARGLDSQRVRSGWSRAVVGLARGVVVLCVSDRQGWRVGSTGHGSEEFRLLKEARDLEDCLYS